VPCRYGFSGDSGDNIATRQPHLKMVGWGPCPPTSDHRGTPSYCYPSSSSPSNLPSSGFQTTALPWCNHGAEPRRTWKDNRVGAQVGLGCERRHGDN
jgi:hypothetical protein